MSIVILYGAYTHANAARCNLKFYSIVSAAVSNTLLAHSAAVRTVTVITGVTNVTDIGRDCSVELFVIR